jgi:hypothetical protein
MVDTNDGKKTPEERVALVARDLKLQRGLIAKDRTLTDEAFALIRLELGRVAKRRARWLLVRGRWEDACQAVFGLIVRWRDEGGKLREDESIWFLTQRALKQVADEMKSDLKWAKLGFSLEEHRGRSKTQAELEEEMLGSVHAPQREVSSERRVAAAEQWRWICETSERLSEDDQRVVQAIGDVDMGQAESLADALGVANDAARKRKQRLRWRGAARARSTPMRSSSFTLPSLGRTIASTS